MFEETIPSPVALFEKIPLSLPCRKKIESYRQTIRNILTKKDPRLLLIAGPCSIHDLKVIYDYAALFQKLAQETGETFFFVLRTYYEKARTAKGWKGFVNDPLLNDSYDIVKGLHLARQLLVDLTEIGIPVSTELLDTHTAPYFTDLLSWGCIGARTSTSQPHRQLAASLDFPVGFKNTTDGNIDNAIHGVLAAESSHTFLGIDPLGKIARLLARGNPDCHIVLRGGEKGPNYDSASIAEALNRCTTVGILPRLIVDCSHDNCGKRHHEQAEVFQSVIQQVLEGNTGIAGVMLESNLNEGNQPITPHPHYGVSVTDPCLGWQATETLIRWAAQALKASQFITL